MNKIENKNQERISRRRFLEFTGKPMVVTGLGVVIALSTKYSKSVLGCGGCCCNTYTPPCNCEPDSCTTNPAICCW